MLGSECLRTVTILRLPRLMDISVSTWSHRASSKKKKPTKPPLLSQISHLSYLPCSRGHVPSLCTPYVGCKPCCVPVALSPHHPCSWEAPRDYAHSVSDSRQSQNLNTYPGNGGAGFLVLLGSSYTCPRDCLNP